jgi:hypothetical protein
MEEREGGASMKLTDRQKAVLAVLTDEFQECSPIRVATGDCFADTRLLQLHAKGLVERTDIHRPGTNRTWLGYRLTAAGKIAQRDLP